MGQWNQDIACQSLGGHLSSVSKALCIVGLSVDPDTMCLQHSSETPRGQDGRQTMMFSATFPREMQVRVQLRIKQLTVRGTPQNIHLLPQSRPGNAQLLNPFENVPKPMSNFTFRCCCLKHFQNHNVVKTCENIEEECKEP